MDNIPLSSLFIALVILLLLSAFFSGSETGLMSLNRYKMRHLAEKNHKGAKLAQSLLNKTDRLLSLILVCNNLVNIMASAIATVIGLRLAGDAGVAIATGLLTLVMLVFSEILPKTIATIFPEKVGFTTSFILAPLQKLLSPILYFINLIIKGLLAILRIKPSNKTNLSTEELRSVVLESSKVMPAYHQEMFLSILDLEKASVDDVMQVRNKISKIDIDDDLDAILRQLNHFASDYVVMYKGDLDKNILGILRLKEAFRMLIDSDEPSKETLIKSLDTVYFIPENTPLTKQLMNFKANNKRVGLVVDEYGDIKGLLTIEAILEEIVGEFTAVTKPKLKQLPQIKDDALIIHGTTNIRDLNKQFGWELPLDHSRTLNGLILHFLEKIPEEGFKFTMYDLEITVLTVADNMVKQVKITTIKEDLC